MFCTSEFALNLILFTSRFAPEKMYTEESFGNVNNLKFTNHKMYLGKLQK